MRFSRFAAGLLLAGIALTAALILVPSREQATVEVGFNNNAVTDRVATPAQAANLLNAVGATIDRVQINWASLEPAPGSYRFEPYDAIYRADLALGVRPLFIFAYAPNWAAAPGCDSEIAHCPPAPNHYRDAARTSAVIARRYPKLAGIEIWNEPNTGYFWSPGADPAAYAALLRASYRAIKKADPSMAVAGGSMSSSPVSGGGYLTGADFLRGIYSHGAKGAMDAVSVHAYPDPADTTAQSAVEALEDVRRVRDEFGDTTPIWVTETGISTTGKRAVPDRVQALVLLRLYDDLRRQSGVEMVLFHTLVEPPGPADDLETGFGIVGDHLRPKPGYCALSGAWDGRAC